jgi:hypothetical protein
MVHPTEVKAARLQMMKARKELENYEKLKGHSASTEHMRLIKVFANSAKIYLRVSMSEND